MEDRTMDSSVLQRKETFVGIEEVVWTVERKVLEVFAEHEEVVDPLEAMIRFMEGLVDINATEI